MLDVSAIVSHSADWHADRKTGIGGSDAKKIMSGDWHSLWLEKTGQAQPEDLSDNLAVIMGSWTEPLNHYWFQKQTGIGVDRSPDICDGRYHPEHTFMRCNLDGMAIDAVWEAKHVNAFSKDDEIITRYYWQCQHNMAVVGADMTYLSVIFGNGKWQYFEIPRDEQGVADLIARETEFWRHVVEGIEPENVAAAEKVVIALDDMREVDMTGNNEFASHAVDWLENITAAKKHEAATKAIKALIEPDVKLAFGHGIKVSRAKNGAITIRSEK